MSNEMAPMRSYSEFVAEARDAEARDPWGVEAIRAETAALRRTTERLAALESPEFRPDHARAQEIEAGR